MAARRFRSCRVRSWAGPCAFPLQFRVHGAAGPAGPAAGKPHGASHLGVPPLALSVLIACRHSISAPPGAGLGFPPGSAHPRQERGGARLSQHGVTAPGDDAGYVDLEGDHQVGDQDSFPPWRRVTGLVSPSLSWNGQSRPVTEHRPPAWGQHGVLYNNQKSNRTLMTAFPFRSCWAPHGAPASGRRDLATGAFSLHKKGVSVGFDTILERVGGRAEVLNGVLAGRVEPDLDFPWTFQGGWPGRPVPLTPARCRAGRWDTSGWRRMLSAGPGPGRS